MKLQFLGAARQVTGSQYYVEADGAQLLVDCGMYQERAYLARNWDPSPRAAPRPRRPAADPRPRRPLRPGAEAGAGGLSRPDHHHLASADLVDWCSATRPRFKWKTPRSRRSGIARKAARGSTPSSRSTRCKDVERTLPLLEGVPYDRPVQDQRPRHAVFHDAGHILGSAMIELRVRTDGQPRRLIFTGDLGQWDQPIVRNPTVFTEADYVVMESTYGDRDHERPRRRSSRNWRR